MTRSKLLNLPLPHTGTWWLWQPVCLWRPSSEWRLVPSGSSLHPWTPACCYSRRPEWRWPSPKEKNKKPSLHCKELAQGITSTRVKSTAKHWSGATIPLTARASKEQRDKRIKHVRVCSKERYLHLVHFLALWWITAAAGWLDKEAACMMSINNVGEFDKLNVACCSSPQPHFGHSASLLDF